MTLGPLDLAGGPFLALYLLLLAGTVAAGLIIPGLVRPAGQQRRVANADQLAFLAGGRVRFAEAIVSRLLAAKALAIGGRSRLHVVAPDAAASSAEQAVLALPSPTRWREVQAALAPHVEMLETRLVSAGLLMREEERKRTRFVTTLPYFLLLAFGAAKLGIGIARDRPVGYLTALLVLTAVAALIRWIALDARTRAGREAVAVAREQAGRLRIAPTNAEIGQAVALFGTPVLVGSGWSDFHRMRQAATTGSAGGGSCGDGGGGGCGGGGGGCGGGGGGCGGCGGGGGD